MGAHKRQMESDLCPCHALLRTIRSVGIVSRSADAAKDNGHRMPDATAEPLVLAREPNNEFLHTGVSAVTQHRVDIPIAHRLLSKRERAMFAHLPSGAQKGAEGRAR
jgi:hypothetical protein